MKNTEAAFHWIIDILENKGIRYKISGGFAARMHGVSRELADIDIEIADEDILKITGDVEPYIVFGPARFRDESWDLKLMTLNYLGQEIDIAGNEALMYDRSHSVWERCSNGLEDAELMEVFHRKVWIESPDSLIRYKTKLGREVDIEDVRQLKAIQEKK